MKIKLIEVPIIDLITGFVDNEEQGVIGFNGKLNIRPAYQREFVYKDKQRNAVIDTVKKNFPLNVMYWVKNSDDTYEVLDGQQRTISICQYLDSQFSINKKYFHNLTPDESAAILDYNLMIYVCEGTDKEKLDWFKVINTAGEALKPQELRNAVYTGSWLADAKKYFSRTGGPAYTLGNKLIHGSAIRQKYLEITLKWINNGDISGYMADHQFDVNSREIWLYYQSVINWVNVTFDVQTKWMKGVDWGYLYNDYKDVLVDNNEVNRLLADDEVKNKKGIYSFVLTRETKYLNLREFSDSQKERAHQKQNGICPHCIDEGKESSYTLEEMEADHIIPWSKDGETTDDNLQMLCMHHNRVKSNK